MKKHFIWLAIGATAMTACTEVDVVEEGNQSNAIGFVNVINKNSRSTELTETSFDLFSVFGYYTKPGLEAHPIQVFGETDLVKKVSGNWVYDNTRYWNPGATYYFYAYSCQDIELASGKGTAYFDITNTSTGVDLNDRALKINDYICDEDHQHDLVCAFAEGIEGQNSGNQPVKFLFRHALSRISAEFINEFPADYTIEVSDVKLENFYDKANLEVRKLDGAYKSYPEYGAQENYDELPWTNPSRSYSYTGELNKQLSMPNVVTDGVVTNTTEPVYVLPVVYNQSNVRLVFTITVKHGDDVFLARTLKGQWQPEWLPGTAYKYIVHLTGANAQLEPIVFEASQDIANEDTWQGDAPVNIKFEM